MVHLDAGNRLQASSVSRKSPLLKPVGSPTVAASL
jgi:hypothetical protein